MQANSPARLRLDARGLLGGLLRPTAIGLGLGLGWGAFFFFTSPGGLKGVGLVCSYLFFFFIWVIEFQRPKKKQKEKKNKSEHTHPLKKQLEKLFFDLKKKTSSPPPRFPGRGKTSKLRFFFFFCFLSPDSKTVTRGLCKRSQSLGGTGFVQVPKGKGGVFCGLGLGAALDLPSLPPHKLSTQKKTKKHKSAEALPPPRLRPSYRVGLTG